MEKINIKRVISIFGVVSLILLNSCEENLLEKYPTDKLSEATFWKTEKDAMLALTGVYNEGTQANGRYFSFWMKGTTLRFDLFADNGNEKDNRLEYNGNLTSTDTYVTNMWRASWNKIVRCNNFLANIPKVQMNEQKKNAMVAEVKFIRAYFYFLMSQYWGGVPLFSEVLDYQTANTISRSAKSEVVAFALNELTGAAENLPGTRPNSEYGRITKGAALAIKGRLLMSEKRWSEAAQTYKQIIDLGIYQIDPRYKQLFEDEGEMNKEVILAFPLVENTYGDDVIKLSIPTALGGWKQFNVFNDLVEDYEMIDGKTIDESPLFDINNPYNNRDPRLYMTIFLSRYTVFRGKLYDGHPDSKTSDILTRRRWTGYGLKKFADETYTGNNDIYGADFPVIRYAEILLSYLESKLEAGDPVDQTLLDQSINLVRGRAAVGMPPVTETDPEKLRVILRRERRIELAFEGLRLFDLLRWHTAHIKINEPVYGIKLTNDPANYTGGFIINENGYYFYEQPIFKEDANYLWPIPQSEIDINPNLEQNPGY